MNMIIFIIQYVNPFCQAVSRTSLKNILNLLKGYDSVIADIEMGDGAVNNRRRIE